MLTCYLINIFPQVMYYWTPGGEQVGGLVTQTTGAILFQEQTIKRWVAIFSENTLHQIHLYHTDKNHDHFLNYMKTKTFNSYYWWDYCLESTCFINS